MPVSYTHLDVYKRQDYDRLDEQTKNLYRQGMSAFGGISPTYHIALAENTPVIVWNFHSLLVMIQMCFSFMLTDSDCDMKLCKHCGRAFIASRKGNEFCSPKCKNQYNVYKTRAKKKDVYKRQSYPQITFRGIFPQYLHL